MESVWLLVLTAIVGGVCVWLLIALPPLITQLKNTARQLEITAASLDNVINHELKSLLKQGERVLEDVEEVTPLVVHKLSSISENATKLAMAGVGGYLGRALTLWAFGTVWRKISGKRSR
jgi:predicted PurR-regulated permease PerM